MNLIFRGAWHTQKKRQSSLIFLCKNPFTKVPGQKYEGRSFVGNGEKNEGFREIDRDS